MMSVEAAVLLIRAGRHSTNSCYAPPFILRYAAMMEDKTGADPEARGILLSLAVLATDESPFDHLDQKRRCVGAWRVLRDAGEPARTRTLAGWRAQAVCGLPQGLERLHPSWIDEALAGEPARILRLLHRGLPEPLRATAVAMIGAAGAQVAEKTGRCPDSMVREVGRVAFGWLAPLCESACGPLAESLCEFAFDDLLSEATRRGARAVGQSLAGATPVLRARAMAAAGEPWARIIGEASAETLSAADRGIARAQANTRIPDSARTPSERLLHLGLAVLKSELVAEHEGSMLRVAGRLPAALGRPVIGW